MNIIKTHFLHFKLVSVEQKKTTQIAELRLGKIQFRKSPLTKQELINGVKQTYPELYRACKKPRNGTHYIDSLITLLKEPRPRVDQQEEKATEVIAMLENLISLVPEKSLGQFVQFFNHFVSDFFMTYEQSELIPECLILPGNTKPQPQPMQVVDVYLLNKTDFFEAFKIKILPFIPARQTIRLDGDYYLVLQNRTLQKVQVDSTNPFEETTF